MDRALPRTPRTQALGLPAADGNPRRAALHRARPGPQHDRSRVLWHARVRILRRSKAEQAIIDAWREYHDHFNTQFDNNSAAVWNTKADELFTNLLFAIAQDVRYKFDRVQLKKGIYSPRAHSDLEAEQRAIRALALQVLAGEKALKMEVASLPLDEEALKLQRAVSTAMSEALNGKGALSVTVKREKPAA